MAEQVGTITKAGEELKADKSGTVFKMGVDKYTYSLFDPKLIATAKECLGKQVMVTYTMTADGKYRNVDSIQLAPENLATSEPAVKEQTKRHWGRAPEEIASIEAQVAAKLAMEGLIAGKLDTTDLEVQGMLAWIRTRLPFPPLADDIVVQPLSKVTTPSLDKAVDTTQEAGVKTQTAQAIDMSPIKNKGDLFTRCKKYFNLSKSQALDKMGGIWEVDLEDLDEAWRQVCIAMGIGKGQG